MPLWQSPSPINVSFKCIIAIVLSLRLLCVTRNCLIQLYCIPLKKLYKFYIQFHFVISKEHQHHETLARRITADYRKFNNFSQTIPKHYSTETTKCIPGKRWKWSEYKVIPPISDYPISGSFVKYSIFPQNPQMCREKRQIVDQSTHCIYFMLQGRHHKAIYLSGLHLM